MQTINSDEQTTLQDKPIKNRKFLKIFAWTLGILLLLVLIMRLFIASSVGRNLIESQVESRTFAGINIQMDGFKGDILGKFQISSLSVQDAKGIWLEVKDAEFQWKPIKLASKVLHVDTLSIQSIEYNRSPEIISSGKKSEKSSFFKQYIVKDIHVPRVFVTSQTGLPQSLISISSSLDVGTKNSFLQLISNSSGATDEGQATSPFKDSANIDLQWSLKKLINGNVAMTIPNESFFASLLPAPLEDDLNIVFSGEGDLKDWNGDATITMGTRKLASATGNSKNSVASFNILADLENFSIANAISQRLGTTLNSQINVDISNMKSAPIEISLDTRMLEIETSGTMNLKKFQTVSDWNVSANVLSLPTLTQQPHLQAQSASFDGIWSYASQKAHVAGTLLATDLIYKKYGAKNSKLDLDVSYENSRIKFETDLNALSPKTGIKQVNKLIGSKLVTAFDGQYDLEEQLLTLKDFDLKTDALTSAGRGIASLNGKSEIELDTQLLNLSKISEQITGKIDVNTKLERASGTSDLILTLSSTENAIKSKNTTLTQLFNENMTLDAKAILAPTGALQLKANLQSELTASAIEANLVDNYLESDLTSNILALSTDQISLKNASFQLNAQGLMSKLQLVSALEIEQLKSGTHLVETAKISSLGSFTDGALKTELRINALADGQPLSLYTDISTLDGIALNNLTAEWADLALLANASLPKGANPMAEFSLSGPLSQLGIQGAIDLTGNYSDSLVDISGAMQNLATNKVKLETTRFSANGTPADFTFNLDTAGTTSLLNSKDNAPLTLKLDGNFKTEDSSRLILVNLAGKFDEENFATETPLELTQSPEGLDVSTQLKILGGIISIDSQKSQTALGSELKFEKISFERLNKMFGREDLTGDLSGQALWRGNDLEGIGQYEISLMDVGRKGDDIAHLDVVVSGEFEDNYLVNVLEARNGPDLNMDAVLTISFDISNGIPKLNLAETASLDIGALGKLEAAWAIVGQDSVALSGYFDLQAETKAPLLQLRPKGEINILDANFEHDRFGARMNNIVAKAFFDELGVELVKVNAKGVDGGTLDATGKLLWNPEDNSAMQVNLDNFGALKQDGLNVNLTGRLDVKRAKEGIHIGGDLKVNEARIDIAQLGGTGVKTIKVEFREDMQGDEAKKPSVSPTSKMAVDINVKADRRIFVTGRGVNIELAANTHIGGTLKKPDVRGKANIVRGNFSLLGQPFDFTHGVVRIEGNIAEAVADLKAERSSDGVNSAIIVSGPVSAPEISFASTPSLPEDEIISRLLFGRSPTQLSAIEAAQLAVAVAGMAGDGQGFAPLSSLQSAIGLDRLIISQDANSNPQLETGKYLSENVYVELRSRANGQSDLAVEWEPVDNVEVGTLFGNETGARVSVQWKKELD